MSRLLITGSRIPLLADDRRIVRREVFAAVAQLRDTRPGGPLIVVHGACPTGVDAYVDTMWAGFQLDPEDPDYAVIERHPAEWSRYGKQAGMVRNHAMVAFGADLCLAFPRPKSAGTLGCLTAAVKAGIKTVVV